jgi:hypothetical protein
MSINNAQNSNKKVPMSNFIGPLEIGKALNSFAFLTIGVMRQKLSFFVFMPNEAGGHTIPF